MKLISKTQTGRSMVEILGVLAIIGVLSAGGIMGYIYAINLWRENETVEAVNQTAMGAVSGYLGTEYDETKADTPLNLANVTSGIGLADNVTVETVQGTNLTAYRPGESEIELEIENVTYSACKRLLSRPGEYSTASTLDRSSWVLSEDSEEDKDAFCKSIDSQERNPMRPGDRENPEANMILCYSLSGRGCHGIPPEVPPVACTDYKLCGQQCGGDIHVHPDKRINSANPCQICNVADDFNSWIDDGACCNSTAECTGECEVCNDHHCEVQGVDDTYKALEGDCCVEKSYMRCAGESARSDECSTDNTGTTTTDNGCSTTETTTNLCTGAVVGTTETPKSSSTVCGTDGCSLCDGSGNCVSHKDKVTHSDLNTDSTVCACETSEEEYCPLTGTPPVARTCSAPVAPTCDGQSCCALTGAADECGRPTAVTEAPVTITKCDGTTEECCPLTAEGGVCEDETGCARCEETETELYKTETITSANFGGCCPNAKLIAGNDATALQYKGYYNTSGQQYSCCGTNQTVIGTATDTASYCCDASKLYNDGKDCCATSGYEISNDVCCPKGQVGYREGTKTICCNSAQTPYMVDGTLKCGSCSDISADGVKGGQICKKLGGCCGWFGCDGTYDTDEIYETTMDKTITPVKDMNFSIKTINYFVNPNEKVQEYSNGTCKSGEYGVTDPNNKSYVKINSTEYPITCASNYQGLFNLTNGKAVCTQIGKSCTINGGQPIKLSKGQSYRIQVELYTFCKGAHVEASCK